MPSIASALQLRKERTAEFGSRLCATLQGVNDQDCNRVLLRSPRAPFIWRLVPRRTLTSHYSANRAGDVTDRKPTSENRPGIKTDDEC
jgi:hypothetical protein